MKGADLMPHKKTAPTKKENPSSSHAIAKTTIGSYLLNLLYQKGIRHIFGIPGDYVLRLDQLIEQSPIAFINATRENTAGYMADAYARLQGMGVLCITYGVGINCVNAVAQAYMESSPLVVISGAASTEEFAQSHHLHHLFPTQDKKTRETTQLEIFKKITVYQAVLDNPASAQEEIDKALYYCLFHKKPVYLELPRDKVDAPLLFESETKNWIEASDYQSIKEALAETAALLKQCHRPVIWAGHEIHRFGLSKILLQFAEKYRIPIASSLLGKTAISESHPLYLGIYQGRLSRDLVRDYLEKADALFIFGVVLSDVDTGIFTSNLHEIPKIAASQGTLQVNHHVYQKVHFTDFLKELAHLDLNIRFRNDYPALIDSPPPLFAPQKKTPLKIERLFECVQHHLREDHLVVSDFGDCLFGSTDLILEEGGFLSNAYFASLGFGVPGAVGASIAHPRKRVIGIVGDGAFQMTCTELSTAVRYGLDPIILLLNNHGYATERPLLEGKFNDVVNWKYAKFPQVLGGGVGIYVETEEEFHRALTQALNTRGQFYLIEAELSKEDISPGLRRFCHLAEELVKKRASAHKAG